MKQNMLVVIFLVGACYAAPKHEYNRQADLGWFDAAGIFLHTLLDLELQESDIIRF